MKTIAKNTGKLSFDKLPTDYTGLCLMLLPRQIHDRQELREVLEMTDAMAGHKLTADQEDYFDLLCSLITEYEKPQAPSVSGLEALKHLIEEHEMTGAELARVLDVTRSLASRLLSGERELTRDHIAKLAAHFSVSPAVLF